MTLVGRALDVTGQSLDKGGNDKLKGFADASKVAKYAVVSVATLIKS